MDHELFLGMCPILDCEGFKNDFLIWGDKYHKVRRTLRMHRLKVHGRMFDDLDMIIMKVS